MKENACVLPLWAEVVKTFEGTNRGLVKGCFTFTARRSNVRGDSKRLPSLCHRLLVIVQHVPLLKHARHVLLVVEEGADKLPQAEGRR